MRFLSATTWEEVFERWKKREAVNPDWVRCATEIKGWDDWESWRRFLASQFGADRRTWDTYEFENPLDEIPKMLVGPFSSWQSEFDEVNKYSFNDLVNLPCTFSGSKKFEVAQKIADGFPFETEFIGLIRDDNSKIVCLDGHHRATAFALAKKREARVDFTGVKITIALARLGEQEVWVLDEMLKRGSSKLDG
jgi:hypothetical protein